MKIKKVVPAIIFCLILGLAFQLRQFTFWLPHWQGDQSQYVILAMKLAGGGGINRSNYNLSETNVETIRTDDPPGTEIIYPYHVKGQQGFVLKVYEKIGLGYYDMPFFCKAPGLPIALALSHRWFARHGQPFSVVKNNLGEKVLKLRPALYLDAQMWAAIVPFAASLLILLATWMWTRRWLGDRPALYAAFILAVNPVSIMTSNRLWTEDLMTLFLTLGVFGYHHGFHKKKLWACFAAGLLIGAAVMTNQKALLAAAGLMMYTCIIARGENKGSWVRPALDLRWWCFAAGLALMTLPWFWKVYQEYGDPFWLPETYYKIQSGTWNSRSTEASWHRVLLTRPHGLIFYPVGTAALCWAFAAGYGTLKDGVSSAWAAWRGRAFNAIPLLAWCWILPFAVYFLPSRAGEYRYLFPLYPALAAMSGWMLTRIENRAARIFAHPLIATGIVVVFLVSSAVYSIHTVLPTLWKERNLIHAPWG